MEQNLEHSDVFEPGFETASDVDRIYTILDKIRSGKDVQLLPDDKLEDSWIVVFSGKPSFLHANRISLFKSILTNLLSSKLAIAAGKPGSVEITLAPAIDDDQYLQNSRAAIARKDFFNEIAADLWIEKLQFGDQVLIFDAAD